MAKAKAKTKLEAFSERMGHSGEHQLRIEEIIEEVNRCKHCILCPCHAKGETACNHVKPCSSWAYVEHVLEPGKKQSCEAALRKWAKEPA